MCVVLIRAETLDSMQLFSIRALSAEFSRVFEAATKRERSMSSRDIDMLLLPSHFYL